MIPSSLTRVAITMTVPNSGMFCRSRLVMGRLYVCRCYRSAADCWPTPTTTLWSRRRKHATKSALFRLVMHDILVFGLRDMLANIEIVRY